VDTLSEQTAPLAMNELAVESREVNGVWLIAPKGFINAHTARVFESELRRAVDSGRLQIVIACGDLVYIASAGLGAIMGTIEEIRRGGGDLRLAGLSPAVQNVFEILGFTYLYRIFGSEQEAVLSFRAPVGGANS
jgi:anti-sigma B factor antagonist